MTVSTTEESAINQEFVTGSLEDGASFLDHPDQIFDLVRLLPFGVGFAPGTRLCSELPDERFLPFLTVSLIDPAGPKFWAVEPWRLFDDYVIEIPEADVELLELEGVDDVAVLVLITLGKDGPTANAFAPIVINRRTRRCAQVILEDSGFSCATPIDSRRARP